VRKLTAQQYIVAHHIDVYLRDVVHLLLQSRNDRPLEFIADYFGKVLDGTHVLLREFAYVNRRAPPRAGRERAARARENDGSSQLCARAQLPAQPLGLL
jgi:hypothetical protein